MNNKEEWRTRLPQDLVVRRRCVAEKICCVGEVRRGGWIREDSSEKCKHVTRVFLKNILGAPGGK